MGLVTSFLLGGFSTIATATGPSSFNPFIQSLIGCSGCLGSLFGLFGFCWLIAGNVWVFGNWSSVDLENINLENYCDQTAYMFSFVLLILAWVAVPIISVTCCLCWATIAACFN